MGYYPRQRIARYVPSQAPVSGPEETQPAVEAAQPVQPAKSESFTMMRFQNGVRDLWSDYTWRTRNFLVTRAYGHPDTPVALSWIMQNLDDIANVISDYYGELAGDQIKSAMKVQLDAMISVMDYVRTAPSNFDPPTDREFSNMAMLWEDRTKALAAAFASLNPTAWNTISFQNILTDFQKFWYTQILARKNTEWIKDLDYLDRTFDTAVKMAEAMSVGVGQQFPSRFS